MAANEIIAMNVNEYQIINTEIKTNVRWLKRNESMKSVQKWRECATIREQAAQRNNIIG